MHVQPEQRHIHISAPLTPPFVAGRQDPEGAAWHAAFHRLRRAKAQGGSALLLGSAAAHGQGQRLQAAGRGHEGSKSSSADDGPGVLLSPSDLEWLQQQRRAAAEGHLVSERRQLLDRLLGPRWAFS